MTLRFGLLCALMAGLACASQPTPDITVVLVYEGMADYVETAAGNPEVDRKALWQEKVITPYWQRCAEGGEYVDYAPPVTTPFADTESLRTVTAAIRAASIEAAVREALLKAGSVLPGPATTLCIMAADSSWTYLRDMHGVGGFTAGAGKIWLTILPVGDWKDWIAYGVAHEYHHSAWTALHGRTNPVQDMADYLVFEGRADSFAHLLEPQRRPTWTTALTAQQESAAWTVMQRHLKSESPELLQGLMFGGAEGVPRWSGYTIGFNIVQAFLKHHPQLDTGEWTAIDASELLEQASYAPEQAIGK